MRQVFTRLASEQYRGALELGRGKTAEKRFGGLSRLKRNEAKWLLLIALPFVPLMISDWAGVERGALWTAWAVASGAWFVAIGATFIFAGAKGFIHSLRKTR